MAFLLGKLQFWTLKNELLISDSDIGCYKTYDKGENVEQTYFLDKQEFSEGRDVVWVPRNKRPEKLRDCLKEFEELQSNQRCVIARWEKNDIVQIVFNNGVLVTLSISSENTCLEHIILDNYLVGKLISDHVVDVIVEDKFILFSYVEPKLTCIHFGKHTQSVDRYKRGERMASLEPKFTVVDLIGPTGRRLERKLSVNSLRECVLVWWRIGNEEVWPWMPLNSDKDRASMAVYSLVDSRVELLCFTKVEGELLRAKFSRYESNRIFTIESSSGRNAAINLNIYEISQNKFHCLNVTTIPNRTRIVASRWNVEETKVLISFDDGSLILYDFIRQNCRSVISSFVCSFIAWHPLDTIIIVSGEKGQLRCYDCALSSIKLQLLSDDFSALNVLEISDYFRYQPTLTKLFWEHPETSLNKNRTYLKTHCAMCLLFNRGPLALLTFSLGTISRDWNGQSETSYQCMNKIIQYLLRKPLNKDRESQLESALGSFYKPLKPLSDVIIMEYRDRVSSLARRFFHHLLRYQKFEKAFLLAVDLGNKDLFMDLHYVARDKGERILADVALQHADQLDGHSIETESITEESEEYEYSTEFSEDSSIDERFSLKPDQHAKTSLTSESLDLKIYEQTTASQIIDKPISSINSSNLSHFQDNPCNSRSMGINGSIHWPDSQTSVPQSPFLSPIPHNIHNSIPLPTTINTDLVNQPQLNPSSAPITDQIDFSDPNEQFVDDTVPAKSLDNFIVLEQESSNEDEEIENARVKFVHFGII
ncbi:WD repeat-containing and planar cell polarity effector protein fritz homolog [Centruroides vittatus]|uniref:WD repeat-containing and planar cell polarity effector protein fritz homolog n=1 Tax=Centruroides vittatus TaxID=120091 RepID=UPI00350F7CA8